MPDIDKSKVSAAFDRAADAYDSIAEFQHTVCERMEALLPDMHPSRVLDGGCGTGYGADLMRARWPQAFMVGCDLAPLMLRKTAQRDIAGVCGDLESLPFATASFDLAWSSLALQWCQPAAAYAELHRVLNPGGLLAFSTLGPDTLHELGTAFAGIDQHRHLLPFVDVHEIEKNLAQAGFDNIRIRSETWVTRHTDFKTMLTTIRDIGANQAGGNRRRGMMGKAAWQTMQARYETLRDEDGLLPTTYQVLFGFAEKRK